MFRKPVTFSLKNNCFYKFNLLKTEIGRDILHLFLTVREWTASMARNHHWPETLTSCIKDEDILVVSVLLNKMSFTVCQRSVSMKVYFISQEHLQSLRLSNFIYADLFHRQLSQQHYFWVCFFITDRNFINVFIMYLSCTHYF